jgi:hypothetical protein
VRRATRYETRAEMTNRASGQDNGPHYYSDYWLEQAGQPLATASSVATHPVEVEEEPEIIELPVKPAKPMKAAKAEKADKAEKETRISSLEGLKGIADLMKKSAEMDDDSADFQAASDEAPLVDYGEFEDLADENQGIEEESLEELEDLDYDEDEEEDDWGNARPSKSAKPAKPKRERRRDF